jgi:hypothetical protein
LKPFGLNFLYFRLLFGLPRNVLFGLLLKLCSLNIDLKTTPDLSSIQKFQRDIDTFFPGERHCGIAFWQTVLILVYLDLFTTCVHINSQYSGFGAEGLELLLSDVER